MFPYFAELKCNHKELFERANEYWYIF